MLTGHFPVTSMAAIQLPGDLLDQDNILPPPQPPHPPTTPDFTEAIMLQQKLVDAHREFHVRFESCATKNRNFR